MLDSPGADLFRDDDGIENDAQRPVRKRSPRNDVVNPPHWLIKKRLRVAFHCLNKARSAPQTDSRTICDHSIARRTVGLLRRRFPRSSFSSVSSRFACRSSSFTVVSSSLRLCSSSLAVPRSSFVICKRTLRQLREAEKGKSPRLHCAARRCTSRGPLIDLPACFHIREVTSVPKIGFYSTRRVCLSPKSAASRSGVVPSGLRQ